MRGSTADIAEDSGRQRKTVEQPQKGFARNEA